MGGNVEAYFEWAQSNTPEKRLQRAEKRVRELEMELEKLRNEKNNTLSYEKELREAGIIE